MSINPENLASDFKNVLDNIKSSFDLRMKSLGQTMAETHRRLDQFKNDREKSAKEIKSSLKNYNLNRLEDFGRFFNALTKENTQAAKATRQMLAGLRNAFHSMRSDFESLHRSMAEKRNKAVGFYAGPISQGREHQSRTPKTFKGKKSRSR